MSDLFTQLTSEWLAATVTTRGNAQLILQDGSWLTLSDAGVAVRALTASMAVAGLPLHAPVLQVTGRRLDWALVVTSVISSGRVWVPSTPDAESLQLTLRHIAAQWAVVEDAEMLERLASVPNVEVTRWTPVDDGRWRLVEISLRRNDANTGRPSAMLPEDAAYIIPTSGSTGTPKWVVGSRRGLEHFIRWELNLLSLEPGVRFAQQTPITFDPVLREVFAAFATRGCLCVPVDIQHSLDPAAFIDWVGRTGIGVLHATPTLLRASLPLLLSRPPLPRLRHLLLAGEELFSGDVQALIKHYGLDLQVYNLYGPTETTLAKFCHCVTSEDVDTKRPDRRIPVGRPISGATAITVSADGLPCVSGEVGEIYIRTEYRSLGYFSDLQADPSSAFVRNPFTTDGSDVVFATRDLAYCREDGSFVVVGRTDRVVKVRGVRVDLAVVECELRTIDGVLDAAIRTWRTATNNTVVVAYFTARRRLDPNEMRNALRGRLHGCAIPATFVQLDDLPKTSTGKVDRQSLPAPKDSGSAVAPESAAITQLEQAVLGIYNSVITGTTVGLDDDLLDVGGQSIEAAQIATRIGSRYGVDLPLRVLLERSSPRAVAAHLLAHCHGKQPHTVATEARTPAPRVSDSELSPASYAQRRFWAMQRLAPSTPQLHYVWAQRLSGAVDVARLGAALERVVAYHPAIRTRFIDGATDLHQSFDVDANVELSVIDAYVGGPSEIVLAEAVDGVTAWASKPFAFGKEPLLRARLVHLGRDEKLFALTGHVVVSDGWSKTVLLQDLASAYAALGDGGGVQPLPMATFAELARWERGESASRLERHAGYWRERFGDFFERPRLPFDQPAQGRPGVSLGESIVETLPADRSRELRTIARRWRLSTTALTSSAMLAALWWWSGEPEPAVQVPVPNRPHQRYERVVGCFTDEVLLRERVRPDELFKALAARVGDRLVQGLDNAVPYDALVEALFPSVHRHDPALTPMMFAPQPHVSRSFVLPGVAVEDHRIDLGTTVWPLQLYFYDDDQGMTCLFSFGSNAFTRSSVQILTRCYIRVLDALAVDSVQTVGMLLQTFEASHRASP